MKKFVYLSLIFFLGIGLNHSVAQKKEDKTVYFKSSMHCGSCENTLTEHLKFEKGVKGLAIDHVSNTIKIVYKEGKSTDESLAKAIGEKGYKAEKISESEYIKVVAETKGQTTPESSGKK